jgi:hypothetical protein
LPGAVNPCRIKGLRSVRRSQLPAIRRVVQGRG